MLLFNVCASLVATLTTGFFLRRYIRLHKLDFMVIKVLCIIGKDKYKRKFNRFRERLFKIEDKPLLPSVVFLKLPSTLMSEDTPLSCPHTWNWVDSEVLETSSIHCYAPGTSDEIFALDELANDYTWRIEYTQEDKGTWILYKIKLIYGQPVIFDTRDKYVSEPALIGCDDKIQEFELCYSKAANRFVMEGELLAIMRGRHAGRTWMYYDEIIAFDDRIVSMQQRRNFTNIGDLPCCKTSRSYQSLPYALLFMVFRGNSSMPRPFAIYALSRQIIAMFAYLHSWEVLNVPIDGIPIKSISLIDAVNHTTSAVLLQDLTNSQNACANRLNKTTPLLPRPGQTICLDHS